eukprot:9297195-Pyramimonas_sp.AAC.1
MHVRTGPRGLMAPFAIGSLVIKSWALSLRACCATSRSWEPWCEEWFTSPLAVGTLGVKRYSPVRSLWGSCELGAVYVTVSALLLVLVTLGVQSFSTTPSRTNRAFESPGAIGGLSVKAASVIGPSREGPLGGPFGCRGALLDRPGALLGRPGTLLGASWPVVGQCRKPSEPSSADLDPKQREPRKRSTASQNIKVSC